MKKAYTSPELSFVSLSVEDATNDIRTGLDDITQSISQPGLKDLFD